MESFFLQVEESVAKEKWVLRIEEDGILSQVSTQTTAKPIVYNYESMQDKNMLKIRMVILIIVFRHFTATVVRLIRCFTCVMTQFETLHM